MALRYGNRHQKQLLPPSLEEYVPADAPVRAYDAMIDALDLAAVGIERAEDRVGCPQYDPRAMLKLLVYGYSYGVRSSRKLERECHYNLAFMWLMGGLKPDHKTIAEFRRRHRAALQRVIGQCARLCVELDLIAGNVLFVDGTRLRANAGIAHSWTVAKCEEELARLDERIGALLAASEADDEAEADAASLVRLEAALAEPKALRQRVAEILARVTASAQTSVNTTDAEAVRIHSRQGSHAGYNGQIVVDDRHGLIVTSDVVNDNEDSQQLPVQLAQAEAVLDQPCDVVCADAGYADYEPIGTIPAAVERVVVPSQRQAAGETVGEFDKSRFTYDAGSDTYRCPMGQVLRCKGVDTKQNVRNYYAGAVCRDCPHFGRCTTNRRQGRKIKRRAYEALRSALERRYVEPAAQAIFARRKTRVEHPFGHIKRNLHAGYFLLRGLAGVRAEMALLATCFNIRRLITLWGVSGVVARLRTV